MSKRTTVLVAGTLMTAGVIAAVAAGGPGGRGNMMGGDMGGGWNKGGMRGWFGPRSITADEYDTRTRERFARLDKNGDGVIDATEIEAGFAPQRGRGRGPQGGTTGGMGDRLLRQFGDKDGKVTRDAFLGEMKRRFAEFDLNGDGKITDDDLPPMMRGKGMLKTGGPGFGGPMMRLLGELRTADGVVTQEAFLANASKRFDDMDRYKDGVVDKADFDAMRKEMTDYRVKRFLHRYGADKDGKVTKEQFYKVAKEQFARLDRKGEGKINFEGGRSRWFGRGGDTDPSPGSGRGMMPRGMGPGDVPGAGGMSPPPKN